MYATARSAPDERTKELAALLVLVSRHETLSAKLFSNLQRFPHSPPNDEPLGAWGLCPSDSVSRQAVL